MGGVWRYRVPKDAENNKLHFVYARYRSEDPSRRCGLTDILNEGNSLEDLGRLAQQLLAACDAPIIPLEEFGEEGSEEGRGEEDVEETELEELSRLGPD
jgi:hypothetical protein